MSEDLPSKSQVPRPPEPSEIAQTNPKGTTRSYDEMNTGQMVFELQGTVGEIKARIEGMERDIKESLRSLAPKLEDISGFVKHRAPNLMDKADLAEVKAELKAEIAKRPTRRQSITDVAWIVGLIGTALTIGSHLAH